MNDGALEWSLQTGGVARSAAYANGVVYFASDDETFHAVNAATGGLLAAVKSGTTYFGAPSVSDGVIYLSTYGGPTYAFSLSSTANTSGTRRLGPPAPASLHPDLTLPITR